MSGQSERWDYWAGEHGYLNDQDRDRPGKAAVIGDDLEPDLFFVPT